MSQLDEHYDEYTTRICEIRATLFGSDEIKRYSVCTDNKDDSISRPELYEGGTQPKRGGLVDGRLGPSGGKNAACLHCGLTLSDGCPGHFGHMVFPIRKFNILLMPYVASIVSVVCIRCYKPYVRKHDPVVVDQLRNKKNPRARLAAIKKLCKQLKYCPNCSVMIPKITIQKGSSARTSSSIELVAEYKNTTTADDNAADTSGRASKRKVVKTLTAQRCYDIFNNMTADDYYFIGLDPKNRNKPGDLITKNLPYPPNTIRPSVHMDSVSESAREDQMTKMLANMLKNTTRDSRRTANDDGDITNRQQPDLVQFYYVAYLDNSSTSMPRAEEKGVPIKALRDRIRAKTGRVRYNLMSKRVNFSARSVITPDPNISVGEVGVPLRVAMRLTWKEIVTASNIDSMRKLVSNGSEKWPGANFVVPIISGKRQRKKYLKGLRREIPLNIGDEVHRHLQDGDIVIFNRQPTLHRQSMMAHYVRIMMNADAPYHQIAWATLRMHVYTCAPYNADFDGDEMNLHVPQSWMTAIEIAYQASVGRQIISPGVCKPLIGSVQDGTLAGYLMSDDSVRIDGRTAMNIMANSGVPISKLYCLKQGQMYSGKQLLSIILPETLNATIVKDANTVHIVNGQIQEPGGNLPNVAFGAVKNGIIHQSWYEVGQQGTIALLDSFSRVVGNWLKVHGFSVGSGSLEIPDSVRTSINTTIDTELLEIQHMITEAESSTVLNDVDIMEPSFQGKLDVVRENVGKVAAAALGPTNAFNLMATSGAKGSISNTAQMMACVGQAAIEGRRVVKRLYGRTLPHFHQDDDSGEARGFIRNNYYGGLSPVEFIFHMMSGREGLIDTAIKTAETGYIQRRIIKALEDLMVSYDATVRTAGGVLIQPLYGYSGVNPIYQAQLRIGLIDTNNADVRKTYCFATDAEAKRYGLSARENDEHYAMLINMRNDLRRIQLTVSWSPMVLNETISSPIKLDQIVRKYRAMAHKYTNETALDARHVMIMINNLLSHDCTPMMRISKRDLAAPDTCVKMRDEEVAKTFLRVILHDYLAPRRCILEYKLGKERFDDMCAEIIKRFNISTVQPGEMVGTIGGQSLGQPATQLSIVSRTEIVVMRKRTTDDGRSGIFTGTIGELIDHMIRKNKKHTIKLGKNSVETALKKLREDYYIASLQDDETIKWSKISHVSRHPANGQLIRIKTSSGREIVATPAHSFLKRTESSFKAVKASELNIGDRMPVAKELPQFNKTKIFNYALPGSDFSLKLDRLSGWFIGAYLADGNITKGHMQITKVAKEYQNMTIKFLERYQIKHRLRVTDQAVKYWGKYSDRVYHGESIIFSHKNLARLLLATCGTGSFKKRVPYFAHVAPREFIAGLIQGYFDGDGNVNVPKHMIRTASVSKDLTTDFALLLNYIGIYASICKEKGNDPSGTGKVRNPLYTLQIPYKYTDAFLTEIGTCYAQRITELKQIITYSNRDTKTTDQEYIDKIPELGECIIRVARTLYRSREANQYRRWTKKESIGRKTLQRYLDIFEAKFVDYKDTVRTNKGFIMMKRARSTVKVPVSSADLATIDADMNILRQAVNSHVIWDEIIEMEYLEDPKEYVYDFTVPGTETFMIANGMFTHNTLNSVDWEDKVVVKAPTGARHIVKIGQWIDTELSVNKDKVDNMPNEQSYLDTNNRNMEIMSISEDGETGWKKIEAITRHLPQNTDGTNTLLKVTTQMGREVTATKAKSFLIADGHGKITEIEGSRLAIGMRVPLVHSAPIKPSEINGHLRMTQYCPEPIKLTTDLGHIIGSYLATDTDHAVITERMHAYSTRNGIVHEQLMQCMYATCGNDRLSKRVPSWSLTAPDDFVSGLLNGYFATTPQTTVVSDIVMHCTSVSKQVILGIQQLLFRFGILGQFSTSASPPGAALLPLYELTIKYTHAHALRRVIGGHCDMHTGLISSRWASSRYDALHDHMNCIPHNGTFIRRNDYYDILSVLDTESSEYATMLQRYNEPIYYDEVVSIEEVEPTHRYVYDLTVADTKNFCMASGFGMRDTFHSAGQASKSLGTLGVPRLRELLSFSKNPKTPRMKIPLLPEYSDRQDIAKSIAAALKHTVMNHITTNVQVIYDPDPLAKDSIMNTDNAHNIYQGSKCQSDIDGLPWLMRIVLNRDGMLNAGAQLLDVKTWLCNFWSNRAKEIKKLKKKEEKYALDKVTKIAILSNYSTSPELIIHIRFDTTSISYNTHMSLTDVFMHRCKLKGIDGIVSADVEEEQYKAFDDSGAIVIRKRYVVITDGVNLLDIRYLNYVDISRVLTNHIADIYAVLGIEAARAALKREYKTVIEGSGAEADYRHLCILSDFATNTGDLVPVDRHGMTKSDAEFLARCTNEMTVEQLISSAYFGDVDHMENVSSRIMAGMPFNGGGNMGKIFIDFTELEKFEYQPTKSAKAKHFNALTENTAIDDIIKSAEDSEDEDTDTGASDTTTSEEDEETTGAESSESEAEPTPVPKRTPRAPPKKK